jgi:hypothetical protein
VRNEDVHEAVVRVADERADVVGEIDDAPVGAVDAELARSDGRSL